MVGVIRIALARERLAVRIGRFNVGLDALVLRIDDGGEKRIGTMIGALAGLFGAILRMPMFSMCP